MRKTFFDFLVKQAAIDPHLYVITGDLGFSYLESFKEKFPTRFINAGIAEQNMIGVAAGLAMAGKNVYVYSIIPFLTMRCFEQIRNDLCDHKLSVKLCGYGAGFSYGTDGMSHHAIEDIAIMRALPGMTVVAPGNAAEAADLLPQINTLSGPCYIRMGKYEKFAINSSPQKPVPLGRANIIIPHTHRYLVTTSNALELGWQVQQLLEQQGVDLGLVSMHTIKPLDLNFFAEHALSAIFTIEEHSIIGGLGECVASALFQAGRNAVTFHSFGINDYYAPQAGSHSFLKEQAGLIKEKIVEVIVEKLKGVHGSRRPTGSSPRTESAVF